MRYRHSISISVCLLSAYMAHSAQDIRFHITDLGVLKGARESAAAAINNVGEVSGQLGYPEAIQVFRSERHDMETFANPPGHNISYVMDMNDHGTIVGITGPNPDIRFPFIVRGSTLENLASMFPGSPAYFRGINNRGEIVGGYTLDRNSGQWTAFVYSNGVVRPLPALGPRGFSVANAINDAGVAVGISADRAAVFLGEQVIPLDFASSAQAINNRGHIAGDIGYRFFDARPFLHRDGTVTELGLLEGCESCSVEGMNDSDMVVGTCQLTWDTTLPFLYANGVLYDLNDLIQPKSHWNLTVANDINNQGEIVGYGTYKGVMRAYRLRPIPRTMHRVE